MFLSTQITSGIFLFILGNLRLCLPLTGGLDVGRETCETVRAPAAEIRIFLRHLQFRNRAVCFSHVHYFYFPSAIKSNPFLAGAVLIYNTNYIHFSEHACVSFKS